MAIKLADVIENANTVYPVIAAHNRSIIGYYNAASSDASLGVHLLYSDSVSNVTVAGDVKTRFIDSAVYVDSDSMVRMGSSYGLHHEDTLTNNLLTSRGGILTVQDSKVTGTTAAYLAHTVVGGGSSSTDRSKVSQWSELVQQFDNYPTITGLNAYNNQEAEEEDDFFLAGYDTSEGRMRRISLREVVLAMASYMVSDLIGTGVISTASGGGSGFFGDLDGDGVVGISDLTAFLNVFGQPPVLLSSEVIVMSTIETVSFILPQLGAISGTGAAAYVPLSSFSDFTYPGSYTVDSADSYGYATLSTPSGGTTGLIKFNEFDITTANVDYRNVAFSVTLSAIVSSPAEDHIRVACYIKLTFKDGTTEHNMYNMYQSMGLTNGYSVHIDGDPYFLAPTTYPTLWTFNSNAINTEVIWGVAVDSENTANIQDAGSDVLGSNWLLSAKNSSDSYIDDIEVTVYAISPNGQAEIILENITINY